MRSSELHHGVGGLIGGIAYDAVCVHFDVVESMVYFVVCSITTERFMT